MKISDVPIDQKFYWKGKKYKQWLKPKNMDRAYGAPVYECPLGDTVYMPSGRKVKPVIRG